MSSLIIKKRNARRNYRRGIYDGGYCGPKKRPIQDDDETCCLTEEELEVLRELIPYKDALIKIAKGEFEIERIVEEDEDDEVIEEDDEDVEEDDEVIEEDDEDVEELEDSEAINDAWRKRLGAEEPNKKKKESK